MLLDALEPLFGFVNIRRFLLQAAGATAAKVVYPEDEDELKKTVLVGNLSPLVNLEQVIASKTPANPFHCCGCDRTMEGLINGSMLGFALLSQKHFLLGR